MPTGDSSAGLSGATEEKENRRERKARREKKERKAKKEKSREDLGRRNSRSSVGGAVRATVLSFVETQHTVVADPTATT